MFECQTCQWCACRCLRSPTTPSCQRHWKGGRFHSWSASYPATCRCCPKLTPHPANNAHVSRPRLVTWQVIRFRAVCMLMDVQSCDKCRCCLQIIYDINWRFLQQLRSKFGDDWERISRMSIIEDGPSGEKLVRMAFLGVITAHTVNGVAEIHSNILKEELFKDFAEVTISVSCSVQKCLLSPGKGFLNS